MDYKSQILENLSLNVRNNIPDLNESINNLTLMLALDYTDRHPEYNVFSEEEKVEVLNRIKTKTKTKTRRKSNF